MKVHIIGGGTIVHVRPHFALAAPAYGTAARELYEIITQLYPAGVNSEGISLFNSAHLHLSYMAGGDAFETNDDLERLLGFIRREAERSLVFLNAAVCDFVPSADFQPGKHQPRLQTSEGNFSLPLTPSKKVVHLLRSKHVSRPRKDIFLVAFKTTTGAADDEMFLAGLKLLKEASCNLVFVNDIHRKRNMIVTPEQARYCYEAEYEKDVPACRERLLQQLLVMALTRARSTFTRSTVVPGTMIDWNSDSVYPALRAVVDHCIVKGAYKDLLGRGATVGHFAQKLEGENDFLTSARNTNFNKMGRGLGLVYVEAEGDDRVTAHGHKPSVGGQSQRIIFREHPGTDCIVHFHCPPRPEVSDSLPVRSQWRHECGSHECGQNTSDGLVEVEPGIKVVYLDKHGPNIVFNHEIDPQRVISFIDRHFDLSKHTGEGDVPSLQD